tara:strand:- start:24573 stop:24833 length:261 start_codon:yes stop_codon:yes gene_type:complete
MKENETPTLDEIVDKTTPIKEWLVDYVGEKNNPKDNEVTVEMIVTSLAEEFPEFLMAIAEENFFRGYSQAISDSEETEKATNKTNE